MPINFSQGMTNEIRSVAIMVLFVNAILHIIFASAVARDAGQLTKRRQSTWLVSGITWAFATLVGGVFVVITYWFVHYSSFARR